MKELSIAEAWELLYDLWLEPAHGVTVESRHSTDYHPYVVINNFYCAGLCKCVVHLRAEGRISTLTCTLMTCWVSFAGPSEGYGPAPFRYRWSLDMEGAEQRAEFCRVSALAARYQEWVKRYTTK